MLGMVAVCIWVHFLKSGTDQVARFQILDVGEAFNAISRNA